MSERWVQQAMKEGTLPIRWYFVSERDRLIDSRDLDDFLANVRISAGEKPLPLKAEATKLESKKERDGTGRSSEKLAEELGISPSTVQRAMTVEKKATEDVKQKIKAGEMTINQAYQKVRQSKSKKTNETEKDNINTVGDFKDPPDVSFQGSYIIEKLLQEGHADAAMMFLKLWTNLYNGWENIVSGLSEAIIEKAHKIMEL